MKILKTLKYGTQVSYYSPRMTNTNLFKKICSIRKGKECVCVCVCVFRGGEKVQEAGSEHCGFLRHNGLNQIQVCWVEIKMVISQS